MANYVYTDAAGTSRRRAKNIILNNPSSKGAALSLTFSVEDRIIMADGSEIFIDSGVMVVPIDKDFMARQFPRIDVKTGEVVSSNRTGAELIKLVSDALADVFITEGMARE